MTINDPSNPVLPANQRVRITTVLWSEQVGAAEDDAEGVRERDTAYEFTNGRRFVEPRRT